MNAVMTIEDFGALLASEEQENPLLAALRQLTEIEKPEDITRLTAEAEEELPWTDWTRV